jgi:conjugal transfer pilus assembly protein TraF
MKRISFIQIITCLILAMGLAGNALSQGQKSWFEQSVWDNPDRDFKWYPPDPPPAAKPKSETQKPKKVSDFKTTDEVQAEVKRLLSVATMSLKDEDVKRYLAFQQEVMDRSSMFTEVAQRIVWRTPELDYQMRYSTNNSSILGQEQRKLDRDRQNVIQLSQNHALFFFFKSDCPYCHHVSPMLKNFSELYGMTVLPISMDGGALPDFPAPRMNNGLAEQLGVSTVPALFLVGKDKTIQPIAYGVIAQNELVERIHVLTQTKPGDNH